MILKFLEKDDRVPYIADAFEMYNNLGIEMVTDLYTKGQHPALLLVDFQKTFTSSESPIGAKGVSEEVSKLIEGAITNTTVLIEAMQRKSFPVIYINTVSDREDGADIRPLAERPAGQILVKYCQRNSKWIEFDDRIPPPSKNDFVVTKRAASAFTDTMLLTILVYKGIDTCIISGNSTSICVKTNTLDAIGYGYYTVVPEECVFDPGIGSHKASLFDIMKMADVASLNNVLGWLDRLNNG